MKRKELRLVPSKENKDLIQSYALTTLQGKVGKYGMRLILRLVEAANSTGATDGMDFKNGSDLRQICPSEVDSELFDEYTRISMPATAVLCGDEEYTKLYADLDACMRHIFSYIDEDGSRVSFPLLTFAKCGRTGLIVDVRNELWNTLLDFTKGFSKFELQVALSLKSVHSLRFYQIISGQTNPLSYYIEELKEILGLIKRDSKGNIKSEKYKNSPSLFISKVVIPAKKDLDRCSPYTFEFKPIETRRNKTGRAAITGIQFFPIYQPQFRDENLKANDIASKYSGAFNNFGLTKEQKDILVDKFEFTENGIRKNWKLWEDLAKHNIDLTSELDTLAKRVSVLRPENPAGYVVKSLKSILTDC